MINRQKVDKKIHLLQNNVSGIRSIIKGVRNER